MTRNARSKPALKILGIIADASTESKSVLEEILGWTHDFLPEVQTVLLYGVSVQTETEIRVASSKWRFEVVCIYADARMRLLSALRVALCELDPSADADAFAEAFVGKQYRYDMDMLFLPGSSDASGKSLCLNGVVLTETEYVEFRIYSMFSLTSFIEAVESFYKTERRFGEAPVAAPAK